MKKILPLLLMLVSSINILAQTTFVPDNNFEQSLINLGYDNVLDDFVLTANINTITSLNVFNKNIADLTGIEDFVALQLLNCSNNQLTNLDVSQNTALLSLSCYTNQLTSLNVSQNTALTNLSCSSNQLTSLDVSQNTALTTLLCPFNQITSLNVSTSVNLTLLSCLGNNLTSLDLSSNVNLTTLYCNQNNLTSLDLSLNTSLTFLNCRSNNLSSLDVKNGNNTNVAGFVAKNNPNLLCINVDDQLYSEALWGNNTDVQTNFSEDCSSLVYAYVPDDNFEQALKDMGYDSGILDNYVEVTVTGIDQLTSLDISNLNIIDLTGIEYFTALTDLTCRNNQLTSLDLSGNSALVNLYCDTNQLTSLNVGKNPALKYLDCSINQLTNLGISQNSILENLVCINNELGSLNLSKNTKLKTLLCSGNQLTSLNVKNANNTSITNFDSKNNPNLTCIQVDDVTYSSTNWTDIDASSSFNEDCSSVYLTFVPDNNFEQALIDLGYDTGALDDYVPTVNINTITNLTVFNKNISDLTGIEDFVALTFLDCRTNNLTSLDLSQNTALSLLSCGSNQLTSLNTSQNIALTALDCSNNQLISLDVSQNNALTSLFCSDNQLTSLNVKNGNNSNFDDFNATNNPNLSCIEVDDATYSTANWKDIDPASSFSEDCTLVGLTYVPDNNFEQTLINLGYDSGALDNYVPTANINTVVSLGIANKGIADLTGIEDFVALKHLYCNNNAFTSIDVSQNISLITVSCFNNQLTILDLSQNLNLETLSIYNNELSSLDLSLNTSLKSLQCRENQLISLNVKNGNNTNFTDFDARNNSSLTCILVDDVTYATTNWTNIDPASSFSEDCSTLGIEDLLANTEKLIVTNYNDTSIKVKTKNGSIIKSFRAYNTLGKIIMNTKPNQSEFFIDTQYSRHGTILFIKVELENAYVLYKKFLKI